MLETLETGPSFLFSLFRFLIARRWWVVGIYALLLGPSVYFALKVDQDNSLDRLIVKSDPDYIAARELEGVFGGGEYAVVLAEANDPFDSQVVRRVDAMERALAAIPHVQTNSIIEVYRRARAGFHATPDESEALRRFAAGTDLFRKQGLFGPRFLSVPLILNVHGTAERAQVLGAVDQILAGTQQDLGPITALRKVGQPWVNAFLDRDTRSQGLRSFPLFMLFVLVLNVTLYRSFRTVVAFLIPLGVCAAMTVGYIGLTGGTFTIVSALVPMTILIVCTASLVYIHSRFVEQPEGRTVDDHQVFALVNKFVAVTASVFATAVGFAALAVSKIRPIREMGMWVAVGLAFTWVVVFTLFPALQRILRTPTQQERKIAGQWFLRLVQWMPLFSYRFRWVLVPGSLVLCAAGAVALFGIPGVLPRMELETNAIEYIPHQSDLYQDTKRLESTVGGLAITEVWLSGQQGSLSQPAVIRGLDHLQAGLEAIPGVGAVVGLPSMLRSLRYVSGKGDKLPEDDEALEKITDTLEDLVPREPLMQRFVEKTNFSQTHLSVLTRTTDYQGFVVLRDALLGCWAQAQQRDPVLKQFTMRIAGLAPLQAKIAFHLVPTLVESFGLTVVIIFGAFLLVFRSGPARIMAMIPSLFAILVMFGLMRLLGMSLNVATILIASTVLGTSENDQIHFFYHYQEKRRTGTTEEALRHTLLVSGRAIFFATLINAGGFLAFAMAELPPIRQFGILSCLAFVLSMVADFTALPAALWLVFRDKPDHLKPAPPKTPEM